MIDMANDLYADTRHAYYLRNREELLAKRKARYALRIATDSGYRERIKQDALKRRTSEAGKRYITTNARNQHLKMKYGITEIEYNIKCGEQAGVCALCGEPPIGKGPSGRRLHVDHNHQTRKVRDLLCGRCNSGLGYFRESTDLLMRAITYLEKHGGEA